MFPAASGPCLAGSAQMQNQNQGDDKARHTQYDKQIHLNNQHVLRTIQRSPRLDHKILASKTHPNRRRLHNHTKRYTIHTNLCFVIVLCWCIYECVDSISLCTSAANHTVAVPCDSNMSSPQLQDTTGRLQPNANANHDNQHVEY